MTQVGGGRRLQANGGVTGIGNDGFVNATTDYYFFPLPQAGKCSRP